MRYLVKNVYTALKEGDLDERKRYRAGPHKVGKESRRSLFEIYKSGMERRPGQTVPV